MNSIDASFGLVRWGALVVAHHLISLWPFYALPAWFRAGDLVGDRSLNQLPYPYYASYINRRSLHWKYVVPWSACL